jgi:hypothetical protein
MTPQLDPDIVKLLQKNKRIEALRRLRARTNIGLEEAKALIDAMQQTLGPAGTPSIPTPKRPGQAPPAAVRESPRPHSQQHQFSSVPEQTRAQAHEWQERSGLGPGEVPAPQYQIVRAALFLMVFLAGILYLLS